MTVDIPSQKRRFWLLTMPRTASNMLVRVLNLEAQGVRPARNGGYFFFPSMLCRLGLFDKPAEEWTDEERANMQNSLAKSLESLEDYLEAAEAEGQKVFVKEHVSFINDAFYEHKYIHGAVAGDADHPPAPVPAREFARATRSPLNMTALPDEFLKSWYPTFLIRHPALMLPSLYRTALRGVEMDGKGRANNEPYEVEATLDFVRALHDFYAGHFGKGSQWPIVLDADDVIAHPELTMKYAGLVGLDREKLRFSWEKAGQEQLDKLLPAEQVMLGTINASTGVDKGKIAGDVDIGAEAAKWRSEFGEEAGRKLERWVRAAMPNYHYLREKRLTLD
ncbi:hypothetical protein SAMD00023353_1801160 [Rosellinia necatrix]|uniref:Uncharacterized protein n=1 Tax=Rosellinia necatrix TaxID=77044 RepID=A0A1W2TE57_ROSNE|nr:hypothetical protein SAMD00023353_1801160 [Rosellinia necatrix]